MTNIIYIYWKIVKNVTPLIEENYAAEKSSSRLFNCKFIDNSIHRLNLVVNILLVEPKSAIKTVREIMIRLRSPTKQASFPAFTSF